MVFSNAIISDAFNNLSDLFSCFINLFSFKVAKKPADKDHPYGHERIEYIAGMIISFIIIVIAIFIGYEAIVNLINKKNDLKFSYIIFIILLISIIFKILLGLFYFKISKIINSVSLKAAMFDSFNDVFSTLAVFISYLIQFIFKDLWFIDNSMSLIVGIFILYNGMKMLKESGSFLLGEKINKEILSNIKMMFYLLKVS
ncbi:MAG: cation diffusion facilitator family transporter [Bacillales bacterium]